MTDDDPDKAAPDAGAAFFVREGQLRDADEIVRCVRANNASHGASAEAFDRAAVLRDFFGAEAFMRSVVAESDRRVIGAATWHVAYESGFAARGAYLGDLWVDPAHRRRGVGRALVAGVARRTRESGGSYVWWVAQPWNKPAHDFYARLDASGEVMRAHALVWDVFERLADEGGGAPGR